MGKITIIINDEAKPGLKAVHGISLLVECGDNSYLFDTGPDPKTLEYNSGKLDLSIDLVDSIIISHIHSSHIGGLPYMGWLSPYIETYIPFGSMETLGRRIRGEGLKPIEVNDWVALSSNAYITLPLPGPPWEHFLVLDCGEGLVVVSGCMHPGLRKVVELLREKFGDRRIHGIIGGFHLQNAPDNIIEETVDALVGIHPDLIVPVHCSGQRFVDRLRSKIPDVVKYMKAGDTIILNE